MSHIDHAPVFVRLDAPDPNAPPPRRRTAEIDARDERFWIVVSIDAAGPVERRGGHYYRHASLHAASAEARRLAYLHGGRFAAMGVETVSECSTRGGDDPLPF